MVDRSSLCSVGSSVWRERAAARSRLAAILLISVAVVAVAANPVDRASGAPVCQPGWVLIAEYNNSFTWQGPPPPTTWQPHVGISAGWQGSVRLMEDLDSDCYVQGVRVEYTGPGSGGTVSLLGYKIGLSYSIQYPAPFDRYSNVSINAYGNAVAWNPDGYFVGDPMTQAYYAHMHFDINARGAEEYYIGTLAPAQDGVPGTPTPIVVTQVYASFDLPLELVGTTVLAQVHVYPDFCQCQVTAIPVPGVLPPPPA